MISDILTRSSNDFCVRYFSSFLGLSDNIVILLSSDFIVRQSPIRSRLSRRPRYKLPRMGHPKKSYETIPTFIRPPTYMQQRKRKRTKCNANDIPQIFDGLIKGAIHGCI